MDENEFIETMEHLTMKLMNSNSIEANEFEIFMKLMMRKFDFVVNDIMLQSSFFRFLLVFLRAANCEQFTRIVDLLLEQFSPIFRSALTDIWVLMADSAESIFGMLQKYFLLYKELLLMPEFLPYLNRVYADTNSILIVCIDYLQTTTVVHQMKEVQKVAQLLSCLCFILTIGKAIKLSALHDAFQRMLVSSCGNTSPDPNVYMVVLRNLFYDYSIEFSSSILQDPAAERRYTHSPCTRERCSHKQSANVDSNDSMTDALDEDEGESVEIGQVIGKRRRKSCEKNPVPNQPNTLTVLQLFAIEQLKYLCVSLDQLTESLEHGIRRIASCFRPIKLSNWASLNKLFSNVFAIIAMLQERLGASQQTIDAMLALVHKLLYLHPQPRFLLEFYRLLSNAGPEMTKSVCATNRSLFESSPFEPGEVLLFPQQATNPMSAHYDATNLNEEGEHSPSVSTPHTFVEGAAHFEVGGSNLTEGLTLACWIRFLARSSSRWEHVLSLGTSTGLRLTVELKPLQHSLRIILSDANGSGLIAEEHHKRITRPEAPFVNICIGVQQKGDILIALMAVGNNIKVIDKSIQARKGNEGVDDPIEVAFGSKAKGSVDDEARYELTTMFAFKGLLPAAGALLLRAIGPANFSLADCLHSTVYLSFGHCLSSSVICSREFSAAAVCQEPRKYLAQVQRSLLLIIRPSSAHSYSLQLANGETRNLPVIWNTQIVRNYCGTLDKSFRTIGSVKLFLFLYALTVDRGHPPGTQLEALRLLFLVLRREPSYYENWQRLTCKLKAEGTRRGPQLIVRILGSRLAHLDANIFSELLCFCFSNMEHTNSPMMKEGSRNASATPFSPSARTVILEPEFVQALLSCSDIWKGTRFPLWAQFIRILAKCIAQNETPDLPEKFCKFNLAQLQRVGFLRDFLFTLLDMLSSPHKFQVPQNVGIQASHAAARKKSSSSAKDQQNVQRKATEDIANSVHCIVHQLVGSAGEYHPEKVGEIWHFLLLSHPAKDAYLDYSAAPGEGRDAWILELLLEIDLEPTMPEGTQSPLSCFLGEMLKIHGKNRIVKLWTECSGSLMAIRQRLPCDDQSGPKENSEQPPVALPRCSFDSCPVRAHSMDGNNSGVDPADQVLNPGSEMAVAFSRRAQIEGEEQETGGKSDEHWLINVRALLLKLMCEVVLNTEDCALFALEEDVLRWQTVLMLLSKQHFQRLRSLTFQLLKNIFIRASPRYRHSFVQEEGFMLLSRELRASPVNYSIADSLFSMTCGEHVVLRDGLDAAHLEKLVYDQFKLASLSALLTLLEESTSQPVLFWSVCSTLQKIFVADNAPRRAMLQLGLAESMCNVLRKLCSDSSGAETKGEAAGTRCSSDHDVWPLLECWLSFAQSIITLLVPYEDSLAYHACEEFVWLCVIALWQDSATCMPFFGSASTHSVVTATTLFPEQAESSCSSSLESQQDSIARGRNPLLHQTVCQLIYCWLDCIRGALSEQMRTPSSFSSLAASLRRQQQQKLKRKRNSSSVDSSEFELLLNESQWLPADSSFGDILCSPTPFAATRASPMALQFASNEEIGSRLLFILTAVRNLLLFFDTPDQCSDEEETLLRAFLETLLTACHRRASNKFVDDWQTVLGLCARRARHLLAETIAYTLFPAEAKSRALLRQTRRHSTTAVEELPGGISAAENETVLSGWALRRRLIIVRFLAKELKQSREIVNALLEVNLDYQYALKIGLHELCLFPANRGNSEFDADLELMVKFLHSIQIHSPMENLTLDEISSISSDEILLLHQFHEIKCQFGTQMQERARTIKDRECSLLKFTSDKAMSLTCEIAEYQNIPRRLLISWKRELQRETIRIDRSLAHFVRELCHPLAPFYSPLSWPRGRALNTTEGPSRERRRLSAVHYPFSPKFIKKARREAVERGHNAPMPLDNLLNGGNPQQSQRKIYDHSDVRTHIRLSISATLVRTAFECSGELVVSDAKLYFLGETAKSTQKGVVLAPVTYSWRYTQIREIFSRFYLLKDTALELFISTGDAFLVVFESTKDRSVLLQQFCNMRLDRLLVDHRGQLRTATQMWRRGSITNFEYLMTLNKLAGRTFNDLMQYPVFPFVLSDYASSNISLAVGAFYRNLGKPMAIQDAKMEQVYVKNYESLAEEFERHRNALNSSGGSAFSSVRFGPYHYGSHYSNTGIVAHYLVRVSPYTSVALEYQDNNFDIPDRLFNSLDTTWRLSSSESTTDFKELIPEFFFLPEMFRNAEGLELGVRQAGELVDGVQMPPWCPQGDPRLFCLIHRQALESAHVSANLHAWIDLIFGYKQSGENAVRAVNVFHPATYRGRDLEDKSGDDQLIISAIRTMVRTYGQMPLQLFDAPHLPHLNATRATAPPLQQNYPTPVRQLFHSVDGIRWGDFVGSPENDDCFLTSPSHIFSLASNERIGHLVSVFRDPFTTICYGVPESTELILGYNSDKGDALNRSMELALCAVVSWAFCDSMLRIKLILGQQRQRSGATPGGAESDSCSPQHWTPLIDFQSLELSKVAYSPNNNMLYIGFKCGLVRAYKLLYEQNKWRVRQSAELFAHTCAVSSLAVCDQFHVMLTSSVDAKLCVWDTNRLEFELQLRPPPPVLSGSAPVEETVTLSCISTVSADLAVVFQSGLAGSRLALYTVNGDLIGVHRERQLTITSIAMTDLVEGTAVNCVAIGLQTGLVRLLETWTLSVTREISFQAHQTPVISLLFANESRRLYAAFASSHVLCWQVPSIAAGSGHITSTTPGRSRAPFFKVLNPFTS